MKKLVFTCFALACAAATSHAATIAWGTATNISADSNVLNGGTNAALTVGAFRLGSTGLTAATVNGVVFQPIGVADNTNTFTSGNFTLNLGLSFSSNTGFGTTVAPYGNLPAATQNLLQAGSFSQNNNIVLTMSGLTVGQVYTFQWWDNNAGNYSSYGYQLVRANGGTTSSAANSVTLAANTPQDPTGGLGQFAVGTFTADATSQSVTFFSTNDYAVLNAFQLRTGNAVVPEPSTWAMMGVGVAGLGVVTLRRRHAVRLA